MCGSGGGGGGSTNSTVTQTTKVEPPAEVKPYLKPFMERASGLANAPYQAYPGTQVAPLAGQHLTGMAMTQNRALNGSPVMNTAQANAVGTLNNDYLNYGLSLAGQDNPWANARTRVGSNPLYGLENPYMNEAISRAQDDVLSKYQTATVPQLQAAERASGSFGNSGLQQMKLQAASDLTRELGGISSGMRMQDYGLQAQLGESDVARRLQAQQGDLQRNAMLSEQQMANLLNTYNAERTNQLRTQGFAPQMAEADYRDAQAMLGVGDIAREYQQSKLNEQYGSWQAAQQWPYQQMDVLANAIRTTMGAGSTTTSSAPNANQTNRMANAIAGGAAGYGLMDAMGMSSPWMGGLIGGGLGLWG
jgi:hypothetical protein